MAALGAALATALGCLSILIALALSHLIVSEANRWAVALAGASLGAVFTAMVAWAVVT